MTKWGKNEKYKFDIYQLNITIIKKKISWNTTMKNLSSTSRDTG